MPRPYAPPPVGGVPGGSDPYDPPVGRHTLNEPGDYADEVGRGAREPGGAGDVADDPFRPGPGPLR
jgi:hypothetical protein